jgi:hypothetical protein
VPQAFARFQRRQVVALVVAACVLGAGGGIYWFYRTLIRAAPPAALLLLLPTAGASVVYIDVDAMRRSGILSLVAGSKAVEEPDYQQFVNETKFDYRQDLDAIAAAFKDGKVYFALRGRFHWKNLTDYAARQGGSCHGDFCVVAGSQPNRRISFYPLTRDVMAMAISPDDFAAYQITIAPEYVELALPKEPVWAIIPAVALQKMDDLPAAAKAYVPALQGAQEIVFSVGVDPAQQLQFGVHVTCKDAAAASALLAQLENTTSALRQVLSKVNRKPDPADLSGVLVAGTFHRSERQVFGAWPIPRTFVDALTGGAN